MSGLDGRLKRLENRATTARPGWDVDQWLERYHTMRETGQYPPDMSEETRARLREVAAVMEMFDGLP